MWFLVVWLHTVSKPVCEGEEPVEVADAFRGWVAGSGAEAVWW